MSKGSRNPKCPICRSATDQQYRPFCSRRCADIDLGRWFSGTYVLSGEDERSSDTDAPDDDASLADATKSKQR